MEPQQPMEGAPAPAPEQTPAPEMQQPAPAPEAPMSQPAPDMSQPMQPMQASPQPMQAPVAVDPGKGLGIAGLILAFFMPLIGLILSIVAKGKSKKAGHKNVIALWGLILSIVFMIGQAVVIMILVLAAVSLSAKCKDLGPGTHYDNGTTITCN